MARAVETGFGRRAAGQVAPAARAERLAGLDLLRLLAALAVVLFHFGYAGPARGTMATGFPELAAVAKYGFLGVDLFFLISGFVIAASVEGRTAFQFAISRVVRLYPAHVVCMTATALTLAWLGRETAQVSLGQWFANLTMFAPALGQPFMDGVYWSIVLEIVFYGWVGILMATGLFQRRLLTVLTVWLAIAFINELGFQWRPLRLALLTEYAGLFASGILMYRLRQGERSSSTYVLLGAAFSLGMIHAVENQKVFERIYGDSIDLTAMCFMHVGLYILFAAGLALSRRIRATPMVLTLGGLTYPLYLLHQQIGYLLIDTAAPISGRWLALCGVVAALLAAAWAVHALAEPRGRQALLRAIAIGRIGVTSAAHKTRAAG